MLDESMIKVAQALATFTNNANTKMHEALEYFEEKVIEAFDYGRVCHPGIGKRRKRRDTVESEEEGELENEEDEEEMEEDVMEEIKELKKSLMEAGEARDANKFKIVSVRNIVFNR